MASKVNILGKEENAMEVRIKGNGIYQGRKLQGIARYQDSKVYQGKKKGIGRKGKKKEKRRATGKKHNGSRKEEREGRKKRERKREQEREKRNADQEKKRQRWLAYANSYIYYYIIII